MPETDSIVKHKKHKSERKYDDEWDDVIQEARLRLALMEQRVAGLKLTISGFTAMRDAGQEFPGKSATHN